MSTGWEWVRDSMARGDRAAKARRDAMGPAVVVDMDGDRWVLQDDGTYSVVWPDGEVSSYWANYTLKRLVDEMEVSV